MFITDQQIQQDMGPVPDNPELPQSDYSPPLSEAVTDSFNASRYSQGWFGMSGLVSKNLDARNKSLVDFGLKDPSVHFSEPDADYVEGKPVDNSEYYWRHGLASATQNLQAQQAQEAEVDRIRAMNPDMNIPTFRDIVKTSADQANEMDARADYSMRHSAGFTVPFSGGGKITMPELIGGFGASFTPENPQAVTMAIPVPGSTIAAKAGSMALQQFGVSLFGQWGFTNQQRRAAGLPTESAGTMFKSALVNGVMGGAFEGALGGLRAGKEYYFPGSTAESAAKVSGKLEELAGRTDDVGNLAKEITGAKTPDEAAVAMATKPLETQLDMVHEAAVEPSVGERGMIQAGEQELLNEKSQPEDLTWDQHIENRDAVAKAIETDQPLPDIPNKTSETALPTLPRELAGASPRYGYQDKNFTLGFDSDIEKALYITAQKTKSKQDAAYRDFLTQHGFDDNAISTLGAQVRDKIKGMAKNAEAGHLNVTSGTVSKQPKVKAGNSPQKLPKEKANESLLEFIANKGGISDPHGDIESMGGLEYHRDKNGKAVPFKKKLVTEGGMSPDDMALRAKEAGYFDEHGTERPSINDLFDKMDQELRGNKTYPHFESGLSGEAEAHAQMEEALHRAGVSRETHGEQEIADALHRQQEEYQNQFLHEDVGEHEMELERKFAEIERKAMPEYEREQSVLPGAEKISDKNLAERNMEKPLRSNKEQKNADEGLFDEGAQKQQDIFGEIKAEDSAPLSDEKAMTVKDALDEIHEHEGLFKAMTTCYRG